MKEYSSGVRQIGSSFVSFVVSAVKNTETTKGTKVGTEVTKNSQNSGTSQNCRTPSEGVCKPNHNMGFSPDNG